MEMWQGMGDEEGGPISTQVSIDSLGGRTMRLNLRKRQGFEEEDVLGSDSDGETGLHMAFYSCCPAQLLTLCPNSTSDVIPKT